MVLLLSWRWYGLSMVDGDVDFVNLSLTVRFDTLFTAAVASVAIVGGSS